MIPRTKTSIGAPTTVVSVTGPAMAGTQAATTYEYDPLNGGRLIAAPLIPETGPNESREWNHRGQDQSE